MIALAIGCGFFLGGLLIFLGAGLGTQWAIARHERRRRAAAAQRKRTAGMIRAARADLDAVADATRQPGPDPGTETWAVGVGCGCSYTLTRTGWVPCRGHAADGRARGDLAKWAAENGWTP
jgi:hypothetical protein